MSDEMTPRDAGLEILRPLPAGTRIRAALLDFDGTISTLRYGWEAVMAPLMREVILCGADNPAIEQEIDAYIDQSTGIQTIFQMQWLARRTAEVGINPNVHDAWWYKDHYNERLLEQVSARRARIAQGKSEPGDYLMLGSIPFLQWLRDHEVEILVASGTDHHDVVDEAQALGVAQYFSRIAGAPYRRADCSKEAVIRELVAQADPRTLMVAGDGKVEISLGIEYGAAALGMATDEAHRGGLNKNKKEKLKAAGAHAIAGDFRCRDAIAQWLMLA